jgi:hypothetical protein
MAHALIDPETTAIAPSWRREAERNQSLLQVLKSERGKMGENYDGIRVSLVRTFFTVRKPGAIR